MRINAHARTEHLKHWLSHAVLSSNSDVRCEDAVKMLIDLSWLAKKQYLPITKDLAGTNSALKTELEKYGDKELVLTYDEYRFTFSVLAHKEHVMTTFIRPKLTTSAYERSKFNLVQGFKYYRIEDVAENLYRVKWVNPNASDATDEKKTVFVKNVDGYAVSSCMERSCTGVPSMHEFLVGIRRGLKLLFSERWFKEYQEKVDGKHEQVKKMVDQENAEQKYCYKKLLESKDVKAADIYIEEPADLDSLPEDFKMGQSFVLDDGKRVYDENDTTLEPHLEGIKIDNSSSKRSSAK